jgi:hypothetical protein
MTSGLGVIGHAPIHSIAKDLRRALKEPGNALAIDPENFAIADVVSRARQFIFDDRYLTQNPALSAYPVTAPICYGIGSS